MTAAVPAWRKATLGALCSTFSGGTPSTAHPEYYGGDIAWIASGDLNCGRVTAVSGRITKLGLERSAAKIVEPGTPMIALYGATAGVAAITEIRGAINQAVFAMVPKNINTEFLYQWLRANRDVIIDRYTQGGQPNLSGAIVRSIELPVPSPNEQQRIALALKNTDDLIATVERLIAKKQAIKQGMLQQLLTGRTRLPGFTRSWFSTSLGDISAFITKGATPTTYGFKWESIGVPFLRSECVSEQGLDMAQSMLISAAANQTLRRSQVTDGDILMTITGNVGRIIRLAGIGDANINQHIARVRIKDQRFNRDFVYHYLSQRSMRAYYESIVTGQAYPQISLKQVRDTMIPAPDIKEQHAIARALDDADSEIVTLTSRLEKAQAIKQGMMQQLLTGRIRLPVPEAAA